ncbi:MAG: DUF29 domain-containing protein [Snowella sp.]|nr:DUF29 domain-containing protein [Snowella sp.]
MLSPAPNTALNLYETDYNLWIAHTIQALKTSDLDAIDLANLIDELEDMGRSEKRAIYSNLKILLMHLLKYRYQSSKRSKSWRSTIREHRQRIQRAFKESPSLQGYFQEILTEAYQDARELAADETELSFCTFPENCPFSTEEILNSDYLPD